MALLATAVRVSLAVRLLSPHLSSSALSLSLCSTVLSLRPHVGKARLSYQAVDHSSPYTDLKEGYVVYQD